jgi:phosphoglycerate dehydrogenase-like enzyme
MSRPSALLSMSPDLPALLFDTATRERLTEAYDVDLERPAAPDLANLSDSTLAPATAILTGWGADSIDRALLNRLPNLRAVFHTGGSVRSIITDACWDRGIIVTSAAEVNARPVAEYAVAMILAAGKQLFRSQAIYRERRGPIDRQAEFPLAGNHGSVVGLVGASQIGRRVIELLRPYDLDVRVYDPFLTGEQAASMGVRAVPTLEELFADARVVSLHAPLLPTTTGMVTAQLLALMPDGATLINTARGGLIDHDALISELDSGRLWAVLDTTDPYEPLPTDSPLYALPNVVLTPHMAGAVGNELMRLGAHAVDQAIKFHRGEALQGEVTRAAADRMA